MPSADGIAAAFLHKILEKTNGTPSRIDIDDAQKTDRKCGIMTFHKGRRSAWTCGDGRTPSKIRSGVFSYSLRVGTNTR